MSDVDPGLVAAFETPRWWESRWYRVSPRSFQHYELLFEPDQLLMLFAGESYKSFLLRQDGRERRATEIGREYASEPDSRIRSEERNDTILVSDVSEIRIRDGSWIRKPKLSVKTKETVLEFYHFSRTYDPSDFAEWASETYADISVRYSK